MFFSKTIVALASLVAMVSAQSSTTDSAASPSGSVAVHVIKATVSEGKPIFDPPEVMAAVGDLIQFQFYPMNHSVVRASFADPCVPIEQSASANGTTGFYSGFMPISSETTMMPTFSIVVEDTKPIWFYCSQGRHCQSGMVGAINPTANRTLADFTARAAQAPSNISPGQEDVGSGAAPTNGSGTSPTPTTMETSIVSGTATSTSTDVIPTGAASRLGGSGMPLVLAAVAASFFLL
jgi:plastocyanin